MSQQLPTPPGAGLFFWQAQWTWIVQSLELIYAATQQAHDDSAALAAIHTQLETLMTQDADLTVAVAANTQAVQAVTAAIGPLTDAITSEIADVQHLLDLLNAGPQNDPAVADAITAVTASTAELQTAAQNLATETSSLTADDANVPH